MLNFGKQERGGAAICIDRTCIWPRHQVDVVETERAIGGHSISTGSTAAQELERGRVVVAAVFRDYQLIIACATLNSVDPGEGRGCGRIDIARVGAGEVVGMIAVVAENRIRPRTAIYGDWEVGIAENTSCEPE